MDGLGRSSGRLNFGLLRGLLGESKTTVSKICWPDLDVSLGLIEQSRTLLLKLLLNGWPSSLEVLERRFCHCGLSWTLCSLRSNLPFVENQEDSDRALENRIHRLSGLLLREQTPFVYKTAQHYHWTRSIPISYEVTKWAVFSPRRQPRSFQK